MKFKGMLENSFVFVVIKFEKSKKFSEFFEKIFKKIRENSRNFKKVFREIRKKEG
jgi:hypothetical protein